MMLMSTPSGGGSSSGGRDVIFRLKVEPDQQAQAKMRTWGEGMRREAAVFTNFMKREGVEFSQVWLQSTATVTKGMEDFKAKGTAAVTSLADQAIQKAKEVESAWSRVGVTVGGSSRIPGIAGGGSGIGAHASISRTGEGINNLVNGGINLARAAAYSGLAGEDDSKKILDTLLKIESYAAGIHGIVSLAKGASALGLFGGGGAAGMSGFAGPIALALSAVLAGNSIREVATGQASNPYSQVGYTASALASIGAPIHRYDRWMFGKEHADANEFIGGSAGLVDSQDRLNSQQRYISQRMGIGASHLTSFRQLAGERFGEAEEFATKTRRMYAGRGTAQAGVGEQMVLENWKKVLAEMREEEAKVSKDSMASYARREAAAKTVKAAEEEIYRVQQNQKEIAAKTAQEQARFAQIRAVDAQRDMGFAREGMITSYRDAAAAKDRYGSDLARFGAMNPLQQNRLMGDAAAFRSGRADQEQLSRLSQFNQFQPEVEKEYQKRGLAAGGGALFAPERDDMNKLAATAEASAKNYRDSAKRAADAQMAFAKTQDEAAALLGEIATAFEQTNENLKDMYRTVQGDIQKAVDDLRGTKRQGDHARNIITKR